MSRLCLLFGMTRQAYWRIQNKFLYLSFVTDVLSHKIVGYHLSESLEAVSSIHTLQKALDQLRQSVQGLAHHLDQGIQCCCKEYVNLLQNHSIAIRMTENRDALENALVERINGIAKGEYLNCYEVNSIQEAKELLS
jgi:putative transposase